MDRECFFAEVSDEKYQIGLETPGRKLHRCAEPMRVKGSQNRRRLLLRAQFPFFPRSRPP